MENNIIKFSKFEIKMLVNPALDGVKINEVSKEDRVNLIKLKIQLGKINKELQDYEKTVIDSFKDDNYTNLESKANSSEATDEDKQKFEELQKEINSKINEILIEEYNKEVEVECEPISEETFYKTITTVDLTALGGYEYLYNKLVKQ